MAIELGIKGFLDEPKLTASGKIYRGRFTCPNVQWTGRGSDALATFTITAAELAGAAASNILWTDQDVQRGIQPEAPATTPKEISLGSGYPEKGVYVFDHDNADAIVEKLLEGDQLFLSPLVWNLRPDDFSAYWSEEEGEIYIYTGKVYVPDAHHRQQAIIRAVSIWRENPDEYPEFSEDKEFKVDLYFLSREDEGNYFFDKNQRPKPTAKSKAYDLTTHDDLSLLAKKVVEASANLKGNVNRVTDRLAARNPQVVTLSTIRNMMRIYSADRDLDASEIDGLAFLAADFYDMLARVRPELGFQDAKSRVSIRKNLVVDSATMMHGYAALAHDYYDDIVKLGTQKAKSEWRRRLERFSAETVFSFGHWRGDLFDKLNPLWLRVGLVKAGRTEGKVTVINTGAAQSQCSRVLRQIAVAQPVPQDLQFLVQR